MEKCTAILYRIWSHNDGEERGAKNSPKLDNAFVKNHILPILSKVSDIVHRYINIVKRLLVNFLYSTGFDTIEPPK